MPSLNIVKIGSNIVDKPKVLNRFISDFVKLENPKILVHGGGQVASDLEHQLGVKSEMINGRRITCYKSLEIACMVYAGLINKKIVAGLQANHCNAIGLSGVDSNLLLSTKRAPDPINYGWVGDIIKVNVDFLEFLFKNGITPVVCAITHDGQGHLLNTNADSVAAELAIGMAQQYKTKLIYCSEKKGVLKDIEDEDSLIQNIDFVKYKKLKKEKTIHKGMLPKLENCFKALQNNVSEIIVGNADVLKNNQETGSKLTM